MTEITILGASGFIGGSLFNKFSANSKYNVKGYSSQDCNLLSLAAVNKALSSMPADSVVIMASSIPRMKEDSFDAMMKNITMAENISRFLESHRIRQFIFLSTVDVYGKSDASAPISESIMPNPDTYYGISKLCSEFMLKNCCSKYKIPLLILRLPGVYGQGDKRKSAIGRLIDSALKGEVTIFGDGTEKRDFVYADDDYKIIEMAIGKKIKGTFNLVTGKSYSIMQIVELIKPHVSNGFRIKRQKKESVAANIATNDKAYDNSLLNKFFPNFKFTDAKEGIDLYIKSLD